MASASTDLPELLGLLRLCIRSVEAAIPHIRFDAYDPTDRYLMAMLLAVKDYAIGVIALGEANTTAALPGTVRSALDAYVDIANLCDHSDYWQHLEAADANSWSKLLQAASRAKNPLLKALSESESLAVGRSRYADRLRELASRGITKLEIGDRFKKAGLENEWESAYSVMSAEAHNNVSHLLTRYFDFGSDELVLLDAGMRGSAAPRFDLSNTLLMSDILLHSTEKVLRHCGHGVAVLAGARSQFEPLAERIMKADDLLP
jgi:Family of unknown function (DUF5677)